MFPPGNRRKHWGMSDMLTMILALSAAAVTPAAQRGCPEEATVYHYKTLNRGWRGMFRDTGNGWDEETDSRAGGHREWVRAKARRACVIRLEDGEATIEIDKRTGYIWYADPNYRGYPRFTKLYEVTGTE
jgi:hypothetical protein